jgi:two-component system sensor histidine kinase KdpD
MLCFNFFFLPPVGTFTIADPQNWVALSAFLVTAIVASQLSAGARKRAIDATRREREIERLYELSRTLMFVDNHSAPAGQMSYWIVQVFKVPGVAIFDRYTNEIFRTGDCELPVSDGKLRDAAIQHTSFRDSRTNVSILPLSLGEETLGSLAIYGGSISDPAMQAISNLVAIARERARAGELASRVEAARRNEAMRSTLLDALAHEFTAPLASIRAAASSVLDEDQMVQKELVATIEAEADRLSSLVRETIHSASASAVPHEFVFTARSLETVHS